MPDLSLNLYKKMLIIRAAEKEICREYKNDEMKTPMHMSMGSEAISAGVLHALGERSQVWGTYRSHAIYLARTEDLNGFFAEFYGKATGPGGGKAGSMHLADPDRGVMMTSAVVGTSISPAVGAAFTAKTLNNGAINITFFGDGATDEGSFWESINMACLWKLPVIFICEDNDLAIHTSKKIRRGYKNLIDIVRNFEFADVVDYDGTDVEKIHELTESAVKNINRGPIFMSFRYYRYLEHVGVNEDFHPSYRSVSEFMDWEINDPIKLQRERLIKAGLAKEVAIIENDILNQVAEAIALAKKAPFPKPKDLYKGVYSV